MSKRKKAMLAEIEKIRDQADDALEFCSDNEECEIAIEVERDMQIAEVRAEFRKKGKK